MSEEQHIEGSREMNLEEARKLLDQDLSFVLLAASKDKDQIHYVFSAHGPEDNLALRKAMLRVAILNGNEAANG